MRGYKCFLFTAGVVTAFVGCTVQTAAQIGPRASSQVAPAHSASRPGQRQSAGYGARPTRPTLTTEAASSAGPTELKAVSDRELIHYRSLINGDYDRIVLDPKKVDATDNIDTRAWKSTVAGLESHAAKYDVPAALATHPPCEAEIEKILGGRADEPITKDEDDVQYERRKKNASEGLASFRRALGSPSDATRADVKFAYRLLAGRVDNPSGRPMPGPNPRSPIEEQVDAVSDKGTCNAKFLLVVNEWWKRQRAELDAQRQAAQGAKVAENRKAVLGRRFAPVALDCSENWRGTTTKCDELPGLSDDERAQCRNECQSAAEEGFKRSFQNATASCVGDAKSGPKNCELTKPAGATIADEAVTKAIASCKTDCAKLVQQEKQQIAKEHEECLAFCRDLKNGFCAFTDKPKPVCIERCIRVKCSGS